MKCLECGQAQMIVDTRDVEHTYKGQTTILPHVHGEFCPACGDYIVGLDEAKRTMDLMLAFNKRINTSIFDPHFISNVRKKLALGQREASELLGGGVNAFSRYENGKSKPPVALIQLLKLLDKHPHLLKEIKTI